MHAALAGELTPSPEDRPARVQPHQLTVRIGGPGASPTPARMADLAARLEHLQPEVSQVGEGEWDIALTVLADSEEAARDYVTRMLTGHAGGWLTGWRFSGDQIGGDQIGGDQIGGD